MKSITLVIAAHPDDEVLGCGGTIAKLTKQGEQVNVAFLADGVSSRGGIPDLSFVDLESRRCAAKLACAILGVSAVEFGDFPDNRLDTVPLLDIVKVVEALIKRYGPTTIFTHHAGDLNIDHSRIHAAVATACRPAPTQTVKTLLSFEIPSSTEWQLPGSAPPFSPNWYVDITDTLSTKLKALDAYESELRLWPHPRSREGVEHLARWRGATIAVNSAEAFVLGRYVR